MADRGLLNVRAERVKTSEDLRGKAEEVQPDIGFKLVKNCGPSG